jgi:uncharacterized metal-binding protein
MDGTDHEKTNYRAGLVVLIFSIILNINYFIIACFLYGLCILSLWYSPDLDHEKSRPTQRWWIFRGVWKIYVNSGHREVLHSFTWGPTILCVIPGLMLMPYVWHSQNFDVLWMLAGLVVATWIHIITDKISAIKNIPTKIKRWMLTKLGFHHRKSRARY